MSGPDPGTRSFATGVLAPKSAAAASPSAAPRGPLPENREGAGERVVGTSGAYGSRGRRAPENAAPGRPTLRGPSLQRDQRPITSA